MSIVWKILLGFAAVTAMTAGLGAYAIYAVGSMGATAIEIYSSP